jgi:integrase
MTGLRFGELAGLMVDRVNFIRKILTVDRQWTATGFGPPKSSTWYRDIPLVKASLEQGSAQPAMGEGGWD